MLQTILSFLAAILALLFMITVHEFGHYLAGKKLGFAIEEFAVGFGPKLFSRRRKSGELFSLRLIPLGGYCAFAGEDADAEDPRAFNNQKPWKRLIVQFAGAFTNFVVSLLLVILLFLLGGIYFPSVGQVLPDADLSGAATSDLREGDLLLRLFLRRFRCSRSRGTTRRQSSARSETLPIRQSGRTRNNALCRRCSRSLRRPKAERLLLSRRVFLLVRAYL